MSTPQSPPAPTTAAAAAHPPEDGRARISFRGAGTDPGFVDAAWWPRSDDLAAELPSLLDTMWSTGHETNRVTYNLHAWKPAPRRLQAGNRSVRLGGFTYGDPLTVTLTDPWGRERIAVLVVAPDTDPAVAGRILDLTARTDTSYRSQEILRRAEAAPAA